MKPSTPSTQAVAPAAPGERRPQPRGAATRERLLFSARARFAADGYEGASIGDVARDAGVGVGTVYHHFADKRSILLELLDREGEETGLELVDQAGGPLAQALRAPDFYGRLREGLRLIRAIRANNPAIYVIAVDLARRDPEVASRCKRIEERFLDATRQDLRIGLEVGRIRSDLDFEAAVATVYRSFEACIRQIMAAEDEAFAEDLVAEYAQMLGRYLGVE